MKDTARWAREVARELLEGPLPTRWAHTQGVARQARRIALILGRDADLIEAAAWLHDIGYSPLISVTGFHPLDGARYLRDLRQADDRLCRLVANHSCAVIEAEQRGLASPLVKEFPAAAGLLTDALIFCDMTTSPTGDLVSIEDRLSEICERYGAADIVTRFIGLARPHLVSAVHRIEDLSSLRVAVRG